MSTKLSLKPSKCQIQIQWEELKDEQVTISTLEVLHFLDSLPHDSRPRNLLQGNPGRAHVSQKPVHSDGCP